MKRKISGVIAIIIAVVVSGFTAPGRSVRQTSYVWFGISGNIFSGAVVPKADAVYIKTGTSSGLPDTCAGSTYQCISGFNANQTTGTQLKNNSQIPQVQYGLHN